MASGRSFPAAARARRALGTAALLLAACGDPLEGTRTVRGELVLGSEMRLFRPCGVGERWWFVLDPFENGGTIPGWDEATRAKVPRCGPSAVPCGLTAVYLEGVAQVSARGEHGHLGQYDRRVQFASVTRAESAPPADCALPAALF